MKVWKKLSAVALALVMVMALCVPAFASDNTPTETKSDNDANASGGINAVANAENTIQIAKEIIFVNAEETQVREPNITYTYTISALEASSLKNNDVAATVTGPLVSDSNTNMTTTVKPGNIDAVTGSVANTKTSTVVFADTNTKIAATANGTSDKKYASFTFTPATFDEAGIYRYKIVESVENTSNARTDVGITQAATYNATRYLDVYVKWKADRTQGLEIYGYVLFEGNTYDSLTASSTKSAGYVNTDTTAGQRADVDVYTTQNLLITGATTGALADANHDFPVTITFEKASGLMDGIKLDFSTTNNGGLTKADGATNTDPYVVLNVAANGTVRNGSTILITGIPANSTVVMSEQNNTHDSYRVKVGTTEGGTEVLAEDTVTAGNAATVADSSAQTLNAKVSLYITNTLDAISPTGVTLRFAPYMAMLGAGIVALPLSLRKKEELD